jgi:hypothetical protein
MKYIDEVTQKKDPSRRKFVWGVAALSFFTALSALTGIHFPGKRKVISCKPEGKKKMVRMLTQDGKLVEIDESLITGSGKRISNIELQNWIKNK